MSAIRAVRWADPILDAGFAQVPSLFLRHAAEMGLDAVDAMLLVQLMDFAREKGTAYPSNATLAGRLGMQYRAVRRRLRSLERRGFVRITPTTTSSGDPGTNIVSLAPLIHHLKQAAAKNDGRKPASRPGSRLGVGSLETGGVGSPETPEVDVLDEEETNTQERPPRVLRPHAGSSLSEPLPVSLNGDPPLVDALVFWHREMGSTVLDDELRAQLAGAVRSLGEDVVKEIWRQARDADHTYREAHPGIFWRLVAEVKTWPRPVSRRAVRRQFECVEDWSDLGNGRRGAPSGVADFEPADFEAMVFAPA